ncbi:methyltransferase family protein [Rathayibacter toxicus]|uniref:Isoprenylcysteine carboxylmethyltransferase family protein n=1 Tax=Rathayibacter toxicus TaxID=145458 RepID=A0A2S5Y9E9_9MICO|nr:isoprenylcysteine carboxylmethyltransferase family protein [Rathayibacter toxicus]PPH25107.1 isoprenylcysteine carboxylmethyltransferase family protein [Rathayibacter toxicus]PPH59034.1 isoprenylcysteine carboxylmethyltransferase family protein [Rathayibacter toxicus]PPH61027.1 isoprenylcysteine carboxylmethyltransferase family protein [Rathayibacter toxicus]PPH88848.1 isoprenylcysteine carboxylmethyltransferase family protein [Rathayibacter toxicus]PPI16538.1 isoprenylcysteine carboxylmeth
MFSSVIWLLVAVIGAMVELRWASYRREAATPEARAMDSVMVMSTCVALLGPFLVALITQRQPLEWLSVPAAALALGGVVIRWSAIRALGVRYRLSPQMQPDDHFLVECGPYSLIRHPGYIGIELQLVGMCLLVSPPLGLVMVVPVMGYVLIRIRGEEKILAREFGDEFVSYEARVKWRLVPCVY